MSSLPPADDAPAARSSGGWISALLFGSFVCILLLPTPSVVGTDGQPLQMSPEAHRLVAVTFLMAGLWLTQAIPLAATSLLPLALFPLLGIQPAKEVSRAFISDILFLFIGGFTIALGLERWKLHRRIALHTIRRAGVRPRQLVLGMMVATAGLSMWISNTATTMMMTPIALALLKTIDEAGDEGRSSSLSGQRPSAKMTVPLLLGIAYSASLGGMTTIVGTPTNTIAAGIYHDQLPESPELSVAQWLLLAAPIGAAYIGLVWLILTWRLQGDSRNESQLRGEIDNRLQQLGRITIAEKRMLAVFVTVGLLWVLRRPLKFGDWTMVPGWSSVLETWFELLGRSVDAINLPPADKFVSDSTVAIAIAVLMFVIPSGTRDDSGRRVPLMNWETASKLPWDIVLLFGGGLALAAGFSDSVTGLASWMGQALHGPLQGQPTWLVIAVMCLTMTFLTEVTSNMATVSTVLPSLLVISAKLETDPRLIMIPATLATSCAFMLPIATAPNAIVFGSGRITPGQMARYGFLFNLLGVPLLTAAAIWYIAPILGIPAN